ncbi:MAG: hypothetical protein IJ131_05565 [Eggerthellaceae bacterium]|nr:hypothetical protein [Eggerthellaceae bacterium]
MLLALLAVIQMLHMHIPDEVHEVAGVLFGVVLVVHIVQHSSWFKALAKGKWNALRVVNALVIDCLVLCACAMLASGLAMSGWAVALGATGSGIARAIHLPLVHIGFCLLALHAGLQMHRVVSKVRTKDCDSNGSGGNSDKNAGNSGSGNSNNSSSGSGTNDGNVLRTITVLALVAIAAFAVWSIADLDFVGYILGTTGFAFIDPSKPVVLSALQYLAIFILFASIGCGVIRILHRSAKMN